MRATHRERAERILKGKGGRHFSKKKKVGDLNKREHPEFRYKLKRLLKGGNRDTKRDKTRE